MKYYKNCYRTMERKVFPGRRIAKSDINNIYGFLSDANTISSFINTICHNFIMMKIYNLVSLPSTWLKISSTRITK